MQLDPRRIASAIVLEGPPILRRDAKLFASVHPGSPVFRLVPNVRAAILSAPFGTVAAFEFQKRLGLAVRGVSLFNYALPP